MVGFHYRVKSPKMSCFLSLPFSLQRPDIEESDTLLEKSLGSGIHRSECKIPFLPFTTLLSQVPSSLSDKWKSHKAGVREATDPRPIASTRQSLDMGPCL